MKFPKHINKSLIIFFCIIFLIPVLSFGSAPVKITDSAGNNITFSQEPERVVSLLPYITEMLYKFGEGKSIKGITKQDLALNTASEAKNVGSYFSPDLDSIIDCNPDLVIATPSQKKIIDYYKNKQCKVMILEVKKIDDAFNQMEMMGSVFNCQSEAKKVIEGNREKIAFVRARADKIPPEKRLRVARVMAGGEISCPGDDSFQAEMIKACGGMPLKSGRNGFGVQVSLKEWQDFNPQFIYGCNDNEKAVRELINRDGWKDVDAIKNSSISMFPCELTCQVSTRIGDFIQYLAATIYLETFADFSKAVTEDKVLEQTPVQLDISYVKKAEIVRHRVADAEYKSVVLSFNDLQDIASTFDGYLTDVKGAANTYVPMHASLGQMAFGVTGAKEAVKRNLGFSGSGFTTLMTGADMDNLSIQKRSFKDLEVTALVTAGVRGNAQRASQDEGSYYSHGTINIIVLTNRRLTPQAMLRTIITATEAKSAALMDLDIRSTYSGLKNGATGTGTDNVLVVRGNGPVEEYAGGHTKAGELIAKAVHAGVTEAILKQNGIRPSRDIFQKLRERGLTIDKIAEIFSNGADKERVMNQIEKLLTQPCYSSFIESAFAISDGYEMGHIKEVTTFDDTCVCVIRRLTGSTNISAKDIPVNNQMPVILSKAFGSLVYGIKQTGKRGQ
ncbi:MAG: adenosylcobinamide amidohydrolase [Deltaproteobacteria bacterium]|nr:adenosylcobinamide amidohydrolase [Deltaproteobacteria bacterium]